MFALKKRVKFSELSKNIGWGVLTSLIQNLFYSLFFIIIARKYDAKDFSNYIIANNLYGLTLSFASMGLNQWFLREIRICDDKILLTKKFLKIQLILGYIFYLFNIILCFLLYDQYILILIASILGLNIIIDNINNVFKYVNINESLQYKTFVFNSLEALIKLLFGISFFFMKIDIIWLVLIIVGIKGCAVFLFFKYGLAEKMKFREIVNMPLNFYEIKELISKNISFAIIGSLSVIFWNIGNIVVSKNLTNTEITFYEVIFKLFSLTQIIPVIFSITIFPQLVMYAKGNFNDLKKKIEQYSYIYIGYGVSIYIFIYSLADYIIPFLFGDNYAGSSTYAKEFFLTITIFPMVILQANIMIALKREKIDMWFNLTALILNLMFSLLGVMIYKNLSIINYSIFFSFLVFLILQDFYLAKKKLKNLRRITIEYGVYISVISFCIVSSMILELKYIFPLYVAMILISLLVFKTFFYQNNSLTIVPFINNES